MNFPNVDFFTEANQKGQPRHDTLFGVNDGIEEGNFKCDSRLKQDMIPAWWITLTI